MIEQKAANLSVIWATYIARVCFQEPVESVQGGKALEIGS